MSEIRYFPLKRIVRWKLYRVADTSRLQVVVCLNCEDLRTELSHATAERDHQQDSGCSQEYERHPIVDCGLRV